MSRTSGVPAKDHPWRLDKARANDNRRLRAITHGREDYWQARHAYEALEYYSDALRPDNYYEPAGRELFPLITDSGQ